MAVGGCPGLVCHAPNGAINNLFKQTSSPNRHAILPNHHAVSPSGALYTPNGQVFRFWSTKPKLRIDAKRRLGTLSRKSENVIVRSIDKKSGQVHFSTTKASKCSTVRKPAGNN